MSLCFKCFLLELIFISPNKCFVSLSMNAPTKPKTWGGMAKMRFSFFLKKTLLIVLVCKWLAIALLGRRTSSPSSTLPIYLDKTHLSQMTCRNFVGAKLVFTKCLPIGLSKAKLVFAKWLLTCLFGVKLIFAKRLALGSFRAKLVIITWLAIRSLLKKPKTLRLGNESNLRA